MSTFQQASYPLGHAPKGTVLIPDTELDTRSDKEIIHMLQSSAMPPRDERNFYESEGHDGPLFRHPFGRFHTSSATFSVWGCWLDVGAILVRSLDEIWCRLEDPTQPYEFAAFTYETRPGETSIINTWMMARKNNELVRRWHAMFLHVWGEATHCKGLSKHPLLCHLKPYAAPTDTLIMNDCHEAVSKSRAIMDYGAQVHCLERLRDLVDADDEWDGRACIDTTTFLLPALKEMWYYQERTEFRGYRQFELLTTSYDAPEPQRSEAEAFVNDMLANTMTMKFCHGLKDAMASSLADLWDDTTNSDADNAPGTFAEYLRWGTVHLRQTRDLVPEKLTPARNEPYRATMFEPFPV